MNGSKLKSQGLGCRTAVRMAYASVACALALGLPVSATHARAEAGCEPPSVTVDVGDTLSSLARRCGTTVSALLKANPDIRNPNIITLGTELALPKSAATQAAKPPDAPAAPSASSLVIEPPDPAPRARVRIKGGSSRSPAHHLILETARTDKQGRLRATLRIPKWAKAGRAQYNLSIAVPRTGAVLLFSPLNVTPTAAGDKSPVT
jgi:LysM repeat protein